MFIYIIVNDVNGKLYIGKTKEVNLEHYWSRQKSGILSGDMGKPHLYSAVRKYGWEHFLIYPLISTLRTNEDLCFWERVLIAQYDSQNADVGYNICKGGEGYTGHMSEETKVKLKKVGNPVFSRTPEQEAIRKAAVEKSREEHGGSFLSDKSVVQIKAARASQDESFRRMSFNEWKVKKILSDPDHFKKIGATASREDKQRAGRMGSREDKRRAGILGAANGGTKARHTRWHTKRGIVNPDCSFCRTIISISEGDRTSGT